MDAPGREKAELRALDREQLLAALAAFNFLARRLEAIRLAFKDLAKAREPECCAPAGACDHDHDCDHHHKAARDNSD